MSRIKVLISGGGIAGNALAFWLSKLGHDITIVERFANLRTSGLQLDLRRHGVQVLKRMGLEQAFRAKQAPEEGMQVVDGSGRRRAFFPANKTGKGLQAFTTDYEIMRGDLVRLIRDASEDRVKYIFSNSIESIENGSDSVQVRFSDDLLVGADGQGSRTRRMMLGSKTNDGFYPLKGDFVYLSCTTNSKRLNEARQGDVVEEKAALTEIFQGAGWQTEGLLEALQKSDDFYCQRMGLVKLDSWFQNRVVLVGDAAYCPSANTGMGTTSSIVGAYVLAGEIGRHVGGSMSTGEDAKAGLTVALEAYQDKFQPFMSQVQKGVLEDTNDFWKPSSPFGIGLLNYALGAASLLKLDLLSKWMLREDVKGWDLPEYKEILQK
ncbi:FAD-binding-3 domain-containing protein [Fusarium sp. LHS14.1]|nr:FAD-binding-3 domain-containing protein [Fusarium sp. LHS14.1]